MANFKIYQTFHKPFVRNTACDWILPVGVNGYLEPGFLSDSSGENIGALNPFFCELTAQYWVWKNTKDECVGFYHYRRYLNFLPDETWNINAMIQMPSSETVVNYLSSERQKIGIGELLTLYDVLVPRKAILLPNIDLHYRQHMTSEPWELFVETIRTLPAYSKSIDAYINNVYAAPICNMFIMKRQLFDAYCTELFPLISRIFTIVGKRFNEYNNRYPGFLAERFLGLWLHRHRIPAYEIPIILI